MRKKLFKGTVFALALSMLVTALPVYTAAETDGSTNAVAVSQSIGTSADKVEYSDYLAEHTDAARPAAGVSVEGVAFTAAVPESSVERLAEYEGRTNALLLQDTAKSVTYDISVAEAGFYRMAIEYYPLNDKVSYEEIAIRVNGEVPFDQAGRLYLYHDYVPEDDEPFRTANGDEFASRRVVNTDWTLGELVAPDHDYDGGLWFYFNSGVNTVTLEQTGNNGFVVGGISLLPTAPAISYKEYVKKYQESKNENHVQIEAEDVVLQSTSTVSPAAEAGDPLCSPQSLKKQVINVINASWSGHGQWLEWQLKVPEDGWYRLSVRYKQNSLKGLSVGRKLMIDGEVPFAEAENISFPYTNSWKTMTLADEKGEEFFFYLSKGEHRLRMESILGELAPIIREVDKIVYEMNTAYRSVVMVTSTTADKYRDYQIAKEIPDLVDKLKASADMLDACNKKISELAGGSTADSAILVTAAVQLRSMIEDTETIPFRLSSWQSNIGSVSSWASEIRVQPLEVDYMIFSGKDYELPRGKANFFQKAKHTCLSFIASFTRDYNNLGGVSDEDMVVLDIWLGTGRDQGEVLSRMTNDLFTPEHNIGVRVKLVSATIVEAFLSGRAPDLTIQAARDIPVNLAVRSALLDLSSFKDFDTVRSWFIDDALVPYSMNGCVYGLPDSQFYNMLFYRTDIFEELDLKVPQTWEEFIDIANQLHLRQLEVGVPVMLNDVTMYYTLLMQNGGEVFTEDLSQTLLDTQVSVNAFSQWTKMFTETGLPVSYDFFNRFRSGEMPMAIAAYNSCNQISSAAPEIRGLWDMVEIPGTVMEDGSINRVQNAQGTASVILASTEHPEEAWTFLKWWVGEKAQIRYAQDIESRVGVIGRVTCANTKALESLGYSTEMKAALLRQRESVQEIPQVPGNYYLDRDLLNAFRDVIYNGRNEKESILDYSRRINSEILRKRKELGLG